MSEPITPPKPPRLRAPIDVTEKRQPTGEEFTEACAAVDRLGEGFHQGLRLAINWPRHHQPPIDRTTRSLTSPATWGRSAYPETAPTKPR